MAAAVRFYNLSGPSLWADEGNSAAMAQHSFIEIAQRTAFDIHPPLYYWLLKIWIAVVGDSEIGLRSLSVILGVGTVYLIAVLGARLFTQRVGLIAAFIAALSPLQVYYSQEARMYMLLTFLSTLTVLAAYLFWLEQNRRWYAGFFTPAALVYLLTATAGLYTHYAYPLMLGVVNLAAVFWFWESRWKVGRLESWKVRLKLNKQPSIPSGHTISNLQSPIPNLQYPERTMAPTSHSQFTIYHWLLLQLLPLLLYLPWLPTAWRQLTTWPSERQAASWLTIIETISTTLLFGLSWPFNFSFIAAIILGIILLLTLNVQHSTLNVLLIWFLFPVMLTTVIFTPAFLKFLLVAAPALVILLALALESVTFYVLRFTFYVLRTTHHALAPLTGSLLLAFIGAGSLLSLYHYYFNPAFARDNYRAAANFIKAVSGPDDAVILNAEGQQEVFNYYYTQNGTPAALVYPLPRRRPLDEAATVAELEKITDQAHNIYAVYWATQQADPQGLIENWLDSHLYKATDQWYGNMRLVSYAVPRTDGELPLTPVDNQLGPHIRLRGYAIAIQQATPGGILQVRLSWQTDTPLRENYTVFLQLLDSSNHVTGQRDAPPRSPSSQWLVGRLIDDAHGLFIEPGTPPGPHRLIVGLYDSQTGQRLPLAPPLEGGAGEGSDFVELTPIEVVHTPTPLPLAAFRIQVPLNTPMLDVTLLGYDLYKLGHRSEPDTPLHPGDPVQLTAYWQVNGPVQRLTDQLLVQIISLSGDPTPISLTLPLAGVNYPIQGWQPREIVRAQYHFFLENLAPGNYRVALTLKGTEPSVTALTQPFRVER
ncbi:MAG: glycosyltransferase family 39 protein [Anaerolineae bacterium]